MFFFLFSSYELLVGLSNATNSNSDNNAAVRSMVGIAPVVTIISWCTNPVVYLLPMLGISAAEARVSIQIGYCMSNVISKGSVGLMIYQITSAKSAKMGLLR